MTDMVKLVAVGRLCQTEDGEFDAGKHQLLALCSYDRNDPDDTKTYKNQVKAIMSKAASKLKPGRRIKLTADNKEYDIHVMADSFKENIIIFFVVTSVEFAKAQSIIQMFEEFKTSFYNQIDGNSIVTAKAGGAVDRNSKRLLEALITKYGQNKIAQVQAKVEEVKEVMQENITKMIENQGKLEVLEDKAAILENGAHMFLNNATAVKSRFRWQYYKTTLIIVLVLALIAAVVGFVVWKKFQTFTLPISL